MVWCRCPVCNEYVGNFPVKVYMPFGIHNHAICVMDTNLIIKTNAHSHTVTQSLTSRDFTISFVLKSRHESKKLP